MIFLPTIILLHLLEFMVRIITLKHAPGELTVSINKALQET